MTSRRHRDPRAWTPPPGENGTDDGRPPPPPPPPAGREAPPAGAGWSAPPWAPDAWPARTSSPPPPPPAPDDGWSTRPAPWSPPIPPPPPDDDWEPQPVTPWAPTAPPDPPVPPGGAPAAPLAGTWASPGAEHTDPWVPAGPPAPGQPGTSPAYSTPMAAAYAPDRTAGPPPLVETPGPERRRRRWLVPTALVVVAALAAVAFVVLGGGDGHDGYAFGTVGSATGDATVRTGGDEARPLEEGETVKVGWVIEAGGDAVTLELTGGGVVRADSGARLSFVDLAERSGEGGEPAPAIDIAGGRTWLNPVNEAASSAVALEIPEATVVTTGNPVAVDCTQACSVEAPAGGVTLTTSTDLAASPAPNEVVTVQGADALELATGTAASPWAGQNLGADNEDGLPPPTPVESTGVKGTAVANGTYSLNLVVDGNPTGDPIPSELTFTLGQTYTVDLVVDGSSCVTVPCDVPVTANDGATGTARIEGGTVNVSFTQPIDCYDETMTSVVVPDIGTTAVQASLRITDVVLAGERWEATELDGSGTVAATLTAPCNPGETLGTSTTTMVMRGPRAG